MVSVALFPGGDYRDWADLFEVPSELLASIIARLTCIAVLTLSYTLWMLHTNITCIDAG